MGEPNQSLPTIYAYHALFSSTESTKAPGYSLHPRGRTHFHTVISVTFLAPQQPEGPKNTQFFRRISNATDTDDVAHLSFTFKASRRPTVVVPRYSPQTSYSRPDPIPTPDRQRIEIESCHSVFWFSRLPTRCYCDCASTHSDWAHKRTNVGIRNPCSLLADQLQSQWRRQPAQSPSTSR